MAAKQIKNRVFGGLGLFFKQRGRCRGPGGFQGTIGGQSRFSRVFLMIPIKDLYIDHRILSTKWPPGFGSSIGVSISEVPKAKN